MSRAAIDRGACIAIVAFCVACGAAAVAIADETTHPSGLIQSMEVMQTRGAAEVGVDVRRADGAFPAAMNRLLVRLPQRGRAHFTRFARCRLATLQARGPLGCPRRSKLGRGSASGGFLNDVVGAKVWLYNGQRIGGRRTLFVFVLPERGPSFVHVAKWSRRAGGALQLDIQTGTITIGTMPIASTTALLLRFDGRRGSVPFMTSPCGRQWTVTAFYVDGATVTATDTAVCR